MNRHLRHFAAALLLGLASACGSSGGDSGPAITVTLSPGGTLATGAPSVTAQIASSGGGTLNDEVRLTLGQLSPLGNDGRYQLWVVDQLSGISSLATFISFGRFNTEFITALAFTSLPTATAQLVPGSRGQVTLFEPVESSAADLTAVLPVDLTVYDAIWLSIEEGGDSDVVPGGSAGVASLLVGTIDAVDRTAPVTLTFPADLSGASGSIRIPVDDTGAPTGTVEVSLSLPRLADTGAAFTYELWLQDAQGGRTSLGRFDVDATGVPTPDVFQQLAGTPLAAGDQLLISVEPIDDPEPDALYPFIPLSGQFVLP